MKLTHLLATFSIACALTLSVPSGTVAQQLFRVGTGGVSSTYHPIGGMIANAVSAPGKINVAAVISNGSLANVNGIAGGALESGLSQSDLAAWAHKGTGIFDGKPNLPELRLIANLYPESVHVVVKKGAGIKSVADLKGRRVALDEQGSGTLIHARLILAAYGLKESDIKAEYLKSNQAGDKMKEGALDAFFFVGSAPAAPITELATTGGGIEILAIDGPQAEGLRLASPFFAVDTIPGETYRGVGQVMTLAVGMQWVTSSKADSATVYELTKALFSANTQKILATGHPKGKLINLQNAVKGAGIPFHPGAEKFYREEGAIK